MIEQDTIKLLRECDAGVKMGVKSIDDVMDFVCAQELRQCLATCKAEHQSSQRRKQFTYQKKQSYTDSNAQNSGDLERIILHY